MKLKPCPFCGETDANVEQSILDYRRYVYCKSCNARVGPFESDAEGQVIGQDTKAVAFWNTRPTEDALVADVKRLKAELEDERLERRNAVEGNAVLIARDAALTARLAEAYTALIGLGGGDDYDYCPLCNATYLTEGDSHATDCIAPKAAAWLAAQEASA